MEAVIEVEFRRSRMRLELRNNIGVLLYDDMKLTQPAFGSAPAVESKQVTKHLSTAAGFTSTVISSRQLVNILKHIASHIPHERIPCSVLILKQVEYS
jgi:hypothetical protein